MGTDDSISQKEAPSREAPVVSLKLFGKTVVVADPQKPLCSIIGDAEQCHESFPAACIESICGNIDMSLGHKPNATDRPQAIARVDGGSQWNSWQIGMPQMFYLVPSHGNSPSSAEPSVAGMHWLWNLYGGAPPPITNGGGVQKEGRETYQLPFCRESDGSSAESNTASSSIELTTGADKNTNAQHLSLKLRPSKNSAFRSLKATSSSKPNKGFVPYRRCVPEKKVENQKMVGDDGGGQAQLCL